MTKQIALNMQHLSFKFASQSHYFLHDVSMELEVGKLYFLRGENGAGKSTLIRLLQGCVDPGEQASGTIEIKGKQVKFDDLATGATSMVFHQVSMVPQKFDEMLANKLSFEQNLSLASMGSYPSLKGLPLHKIIPGFVERFKIDTSKPVYLLSGGQRQVLSILMALQKNASILLLDEPTAALDEQNAAMVMNFLAELVAATGLTVLIICHDKELVTRYAQHGYFELTVNRETGQRGLRLVG